MAGFSISFTYLSINASVSSSSSIFFLPINSNILMKRLLVSVSFWANRLITFWKIKLSPKSAFSLANRSWISSTSSFSFRSTSANSKTNLKNILNFFSNELLVSNNKLDAYSPNNERSFDSENKQSLKNSLNLSSPLLSKKKVTKIILFLFVLS